MAMVGWSRKAREREEAFQRWWAKATPEQKERHRATCAREERILFRYFLPIWILGGTLMIVALHFGWIR